MKKTWILAALSAVAPVANAQSQAQAPRTVEIYGILDAGVSRVTGIRGGTTTQLVSGIMDGSRLGFRGNEDLGGGYRALFTMEHRLELDTGGLSNRPLSGSQLPDRLSQAALLGLPGALQPAINAVATTIGNTAGVNLEGRFWDRQIYVGLVTPVGAVLAGRQYTPGYEVAATFDTTETQSSLAAGQIAAFPPAFDIRLSNSVAYRIIVGPVSAALMVGLKEGSASTGKFYGGNVIYKTEPFSIGLGYNQRDNEFGQKSLTNLMVGATAKVGPGTVVGQVAGIKDDHPTGLSTIAASLTPLTGSATALVVQNAFVNASKQDSRLYHVGYRLPIGAHKLYLAYSHLDDRRASDSDISSFGAAFTYAFSLRTNLNVVLTRFNNKNLAQAAPGQAGSVGGVTASAGTDSTAFALGLRHSF